MAMDAASLGSEIAAAIAGLSEAELEDTTAIWTAIGGAIIAHIQANAEVGVLDVDLDPTDGMPDGETIAQTGAIA